MFKIVNEFEKAIATYFGAPYAVATDCCTHAVELALRYTKVDNVSCPYHTYISIPFTLDKLNLSWSFMDDRWAGYYFIGNSRIIDAAAYHYPNSYVSGSLMCVSFQHKKPLNLVRGGAILCSSADEWEALKRMSYDGRLGDTPWNQQDITSIGYHYYMPPETAELGIKKLASGFSINKTWDYTDFPNLASFKVFNV